MRVVVTGSHGLIGSALVDALRADGHEVTRLVRHLPGAPDEARWDPDGGTVERERLEGQDAVVHLAGVGIGDARWTPAHKAAVRESRVRGTTALAEALAGLERRPTVLASGSAIGYYGDRGDEELTEESSAGNGFLAEVVQAWEAATVAAREAGMRVVHLRSGVVLAAHGGALGKLLLPFRLGLGGRVGTGRQWMSWITLPDEVAAIRHALTTAGMSGPVDLTAPTPVRQRDFAKALGRALHRPTVLPTPTLALRAVLGREGVREMLLAGQRVLPARLEASGFMWRHPQLDAALASIL